ncbi:TIGR04141 family sporadically distributed protein [Pseudonocardia sp. KRD-184]|uniref:TIGR04141 family sporadically distributed protein n=1 Tax=Pseudonocardia oceani TaxID=2792013 RepID=A0ABS6U886_9PSEU|nr:DUF6119 family protein [Pseudonocardia oceani]MBW0088978.1 TIGR04141 family sporadically distributed protein [Pseudonocardia oceani]MBW0095717.1 TIGR04141 family sporadically distributed protein [Pseudonocardia oceani]MBW0108538.1 TIGR04141 family sporadically distributed protein [Pseudonocardia oceani]MBW0121911.1 TIGR04141 family sporadically distributed protein [Pseudonocardia oceani]MBW0128203.1 TIGR04141 family sporadically distributed protein [Pseudonocardia oceani]
MGTDELLAVAAKEEYVDREQFDTEEVVFGNRQALLVYGQIPNEQPDWLDHVQTLTGFRPPVQNDTSAGLLLVRLEDSHNYCYGITWGMGHLIVDGARIDDGFGLRFALRRADSDQISALTTHALDTLPRTSRLSVLGGTAIKSFGLEEVGEVVSRIVGKIPATGFSSDKPGTPIYITVRGSDALGVPLAKDPYKALSDLNLIDSVILSEEPAEGLEHLENTRPLRPGHPLIPELNKALSERIADIGPGRLALSWPAEWNEDVGEASTYQISGLPREDAVVQEIELADIIEPVAERPDPDKLALLKRLSIQGLAAGGTPLSRKISTEKWLSFECDLNAERYVMQRGRWFNVGGAYIEMLEDKIRRILSATSPIDLPRWPKQEKTRRRGGARYTARADEGVYNKLAAQRDRDLVCMDRKLIQTVQHPSGFESCDLYHSSGALIHVKHLDDSVSASHLFNQAVVSAEALRRQVDALENFRTRVEAESGGTHHVATGYRPAQVVLAFSGGGAVADSIFTFSKIALARCAQRLEEMAIDLMITRIGESNEVVEP